jgi:dTDP-4-dehydrorhamnose reductase
MNSAEANRPVWKRSSVTNKELQAEARVDAENCVHLLKAGSHHFADKDLMQSQVSDSMECAAPSEKLQLWGGLECTVNRVQDVYFSQLDWNGHAARKDDLARFASLGITAIRYPVLWERTAPDGLGKADWHWPDERLEQLRQLKVEPIVGLLHHGSGPRDTSLTDPAFAEKFSAYAAAVAARYSWISFYTPINEPLTTARFSGLYGVWYPHGRDEKTFLIALLTQCKATVLAMKAIRLINPAANVAADR